MRPSEGPQMSGAHSILAPSSSARRIQCTASTRLEAQFPEAESTPEAADGEAAHWAASEQLSGRLVDVGVIAPNGVVLTREMVEGADLYYDDVVKTLKPYGMTPLQGAVEQRLDIHRVHPQSFGTPDFYAWAPPLHLFLYDFKFGHRFVEVFQNAQLVEYAAGILAPVLLRADDREVTVTFKIVQPRSYHRDGPVRSWTCKASDLRGLINIASNSAQEALSDNARQRVGPECRDCRARHACVTLQRAAMRELDEAGREQPLELPPAALGLELALLHQGIERLKARASGLEEQALSTIKRGGQVPGWSVEIGSGRQRWAKPAAEVLQLGRMLGLDLAKPAEAITPKQAVKAGLPAEMLAVFAETPKGAVELVRDDGSQARKVFGRVAP